MVTCELDEEVAGEVMGWKLPAWQALLLHRVLPYCGGLLVYLTLICFDFALIYEHFSNGYSGIATFCLVLMVLPALISLVFTLASPPPGLQTEDSAFSVQLQKNDVTWILAQIGNFFIFPVAAIGRYCHQIFWWIEAVFASRADDEDRTKEALLRARAPSPLELYLFLQSFMHAAPHTILNIMDLMTTTSQDFNKASVQAVSIIVSSLRMASTASVYRRFQREKLCGKRYPWATNTEALLDNRVNEKLDQINKQEEEENIYASIEKRKSVVTQNSAGSRKFYSDLIQFSPTAEKPPMFPDDDAASDSGSDYLNPINNGQKTQASDIDSEEEYVRPISIIDKVAPRRDTNYTIEEVNITPPPAWEAPRPGSLAVWAEKMVENAEALPSMLSAPYRRKYCDEVIQDEPDIPKHVPRNIIRGLEPQDATASLVSFLGWYMFFVARLLSIGAFIHFYPVVAIIVLFSHYQIMLLLLIVPQASTLRRGFYFFLAFVYLFCLMEFKVRFRHVRVWHVFWLALCTLETVIFTALWATIDNDLSSWWRQYVVLVIFGSILLSYMCLLVYFMLLKPKETIVYVNK